MLNEFSKEGLIFTEIIILLSSIWLFYQAKKTFKTMVAYTDLGRYRGKTAMRLACFWLILGILLIILFILLFLKALSLSTVTF